MCVWCDQLCKLGPKFGYFPEATKSWLIIKKDVEKKAEETFYGGGVKITTYGKRHLGAALGSHEYKEEYLATKFDGWIEEIKILSEIAKSQPQAAYSCFITGFRHKVTYYMRTINGASNQLQSLDQVIQTEFIPSITGGIICNENYRKLLSLPPKLDGLGLPIFAEISQIEYENSVKLTEGLCSKIIQQTRQYDNDGKIQSINLKISSARLKINNEKLQNIRSQMLDKQIRLNDLNQETGASTSLTTLPLKEEGYALTKQLFWDLIRIRYGWELSRIP